MAYGFGDFRPYVRVADRLKQGEREVAVLAKRRGRPAEPARTQGRKMVTTFWGQAWCDNLARYSDFASRLPRGRAYAGNGSVLDLHIAAGRVEALVAGSELYRVAVDISRLPAARWKALVTACGGEIGSIVELLGGTLSSGVLGHLTDAKRGLFPAPREIEMDCSCLDWADMCKHVAATLYCVGARLDDRPELFFTLRQVDQSDLVAGASAGIARRAAAAGRARTSKRKVRGNLADVFGIELDEPPPPPRPPASAGGRRARR
jgi:uncharacterized Zn finger protein